MPASVHGDEDKAMGTIGMMLVGRLNCLSRVPWRALGALSEAGLMLQMNKLTLLDNAMRGLGRSVTGGWAGDAGRRQLAGGRDLDGERRRLFGVGKGLAEAKQVGMGMMREQFEVVESGPNPRCRQRRACKPLSMKTVSVSRESASFLRQSPVVNHLLFTCSATC